MAINPLRAARIGNLRDRVTLQRQKPDNSWEDQGRVYARVEPLRGDERWSGAITQLYAEQTFAVHLRYRNDVSPVGWRVLWERDHGQARAVLNVKGVTNPDERRRFLRLLCEQSDDEVVETDPTGDTLTIEATPVPTATVDDDYRFFIEVGGGAPPYALGLVPTGSPADELPPGLGFGLYDYWIFVLEGYPQAAGSYDIALRVTDSEGATADLAPFTLTVT